MIETRDGVFKKIGDPTHSVALVYEGYHGQRSQCLCNIWIGEDGKGIFVMNEDQGIGTSVTNAAEDVYEKTIGKLTDLGYPVDRVVVTETYGDHVDIVVATWQQGSVVSVDWSPLKENSFFNN